MSPPRCLFPSCGSGNRWLGRGPPQKSMAYPMPNCRLNSVTPAVSVVLIVSIACVRLLAYRSMIARISSTSCPAASTSSASRSKSAASMRNAAMIDSMSAEAIFSGKLGISASSLLVSQFTLPVVATETAMSVRRDLNPICKPPPEIVHKINGALCGSIANQIGAKQFCVGANLSWRAVQRLEIPPILSGHLKIFFQVSADARKRGDRCLGQLKLLARELLVKVDIPSGRLEDHLRRNLRDLILIGIAARCYPATDKVLVQGVGRLTGGKTGGVAGQEPVAAAVGRVHFGRPPARPALLRTQLRLWGAD